MQTFVVCCILELTVGVKTTKPVVSMLAAVIFFVRLFFRVGDVDLMTNVTTCLYCKSTLALVVVVAAGTVVVIHDGQLTHHHCDRWFGRC